MAMLHVRVDTTLDIVRRRVPADEIGLPWIYLIGDMTTNSDIVFIQ